MSGRQRGSVGLVRRNTVGTGGAVLVEQVRPDVRRCDPKVACQRDAPRPLAPGSHGCPEHPQKINALFRILGDFGHRQASIQRCTMTELAMPGVRGPAAGRTSAPRIRINHFNGTSAPFTADRVSSWTAPLIWPCGAVFLLPDGRVGQGKQSLVRIGHTAHPARIIEVLCQRTKAFCQYHCIHKNRPALRYPFSGLAPAISSPVDAHHSSCHLPCAARPRPGFQDPGPSP